LRIDQEERASSCGGWLGWSNREYTPMFVVEYTVSVNYAYWIFSTILSKNGSFLLQGKPCLYTTLCEWWKDQQTINDFDMPLLLSLYVCKNVVINPQLLSPNTHECDGWFLQHWRK
jgi:hypothetical protein